MKAFGVDSAWLRLAPGVCFTVLVIPAIAGLVGVLLPAFGYFPALGGRELTIEPWRQLVQVPGLFRSTALAVWIGLASTLLSLLIVVSLLAQFHNSRVFWLVRRTLSPLLSVPHVAIAIGLAFVIAPSGLLFRLLAQIMPGLEVPPDFLIVHDTLGLSLIAALVLKEVPFLFLMSLAALPQTNPHSSLAVAGMLGYHPSAAWLKIVLPQVYPQIRLPVLAVLAYSLSVVDATLILGPTTPPPLAVAVFKWMNDPELGKRFLAAAGAVLVLGITMAGVILWIALERLVGLTGLRWVERGYRQQGATTIAVAAYSSGAILLAFILLSSGAILLWAFAGHWPYPRILPDVFTGQTWKANGWLFARPLWNAFIIGLLAALIAMFFTVSLLEHDVRRNIRVNGWMRNVLYVPLIVPQIAFLPGLQILLIAFDLDSNIYSVVAAHLVFVLPYVYLSLSQPWAHFDDRYRQAALTMGASPRRALLQVRLPMLLAALLTALAVGFAVSIGQFLPTLLLGSGRVPTITTEAVALASGGDRRLVAVLALLQSLLPLAGFLIAIFVPLALFRNRRGVRSS
jgi:putative thiamine transport system permease protein